MIVGDFGTSYCKFLNLAEDGGQPTILASKELPGNLHVDLATGHNGRRFADRYVNELIALARGGEAMIAEPDYVLLDCGSRDLKFVAVAGGKLKDMGWNTECGASMGFTIELLGRYYDLDFKRLDAPETTFPVTCGVLGISQIFDAVIAGMPVSQAVASLVKGIAINAHRFCGSPERLYLSGGLGDNPVFVASLPCEVIPLGRFLLLAGLARQAGLEAAPCPR